MTNSTQAQLCSTNTVHEAKGSHLLLTLSGCQEALLDDEEALRALAHKAAVASGATVLEIASRKFQPQGITVLVMLAESHASLHTYPESKTVFWDCFTCGQTCKPDLSAEALIEDLAPTTVSRKLIERY